VKIVILDDWNRFYETQPSLARLRERGEVVVHYDRAASQAALVEALQQGRIRGAGLDVYGEEPLPTDHPSTKLDNVILTPNIGWVTSAHFSLFVEHVVENILKFLDGRPSNLANPEVLAAQYSR
jgi:phosphoglycerate dehydrogenase-like enzyme